MIVIQETTSWNDPRIVNHIYFLTDNKRYILAYIQGDTGESKIFSKPMEISLKGRTYNVLRKVDDSDPGIPVQGSKGDVFTLPKVRVSIHVPVRDSNITELVNISNM